MGAPAGDPDASPDERPRHLVTLDAYRIDVHEVSRGCFARFVEAGGYATEERWPPEGWEWRTARAVTGPAFWEEPAFREPGEPVVGVSWFEAEAYCRWRGARLPTEAEWEKAARGDDDRRYPWGDQWESERANGAVRLGRIAPVGSHPAGVSPYGLHDMAGNVWEWVADRYAADYYAESPATTPTGPAVGRSRVIRGGSWNFAPRQLRATARTHLPPETRIRYLGFRCARGTPLTAPD